MISTNLEETLATVCPQQTNLGAFAAVVPMISAAAADDDDDEEATGDMNVVRVERLLQLVPLYATAFIGKITYSDCVCLLTFNRLINN